MKSIIAVLLLGVVFFGVIFALSNRFMPDSSFYNFKRLYEKGVLMSKTNPESKADYYMYLLDERYQELDYLAMEEKREYILSSSLRYSTTAGETVEYIKAHNLKGKIPFLKQMFARHKSKFARLQKTVPIEDDYKNFLKDDENYVDIYQQSLDEIK